MRLPVNGFLTQEYTLDKNAVDECLPAHSAMGTWAQHPHSSTAVNWTVPAWLFGRPGVGCCLWDLHLP